MVVQTEVIGDRVDKDGHFWAAESTAVLKVNDRVVYKR